HSLVPERASGQPVEDGDDGVHTRPAQRQTHDDPDLGREPTAARRGRVEVGRRGRCRHAHVIAQAAGTAPGAPGRWRAPAAPGGRPAGRPAACGRALPPPTAPAPRPPPTRAAAPPPPPAGAAAARPRAAGPAARGARRTEAAAPPTTGGIEDTTRGDETSWI